jgi:hypothetical protein
MRAKGKRYAHSKPWVYKPVKKCQMVPVILSQIRYGCGSKENVPPPLGIQYCSSTFLSFTLTQSYITGANNIFLILGWDETLFLEPVTYNRPSLRTTDNRLMNMNIDVMTTDWWKPKCLEKTGILNLLFSDDGNIHFPKCYLLFSTQNNVKTRTLAKHTCQFITMHTLRFHTSVWSDYFNLLQYKLFF